MMNRSMALRNVGLFIRQALGTLDKHLIALKIVDSESIFVPPTRNDVER